MVRTANLQVTPDFPLLQLISRWPMSFPWEEIAALEGCSMVILYPAKVPPSKSPNILQSRGSNLSHGIIPSHSTKPGPTEQILLFFNLFFLFLLSPYHLFPPLFLPFYLVLLGNKPKDKAWLFIKVSHFLRWLPENWNRWW